MTTHDIISGHFFIVPNGFLSLDDEYMADFAKQRIRERIERCGWTVEDDEPLVEVWFTSDDCDNWASHYYEPFMERKSESEDKNKRGYSYLTHYIPFRLIQGLREAGDLVFMWTNGITGEEKVVRVTAAQLNFRYRRFGAFHELIQELMEHWEKRKKKAVA